MYKLVLIMLVFFLGCEPSEPSKPPRFREGQIVYHVTDGRKMVIRYVLFDGWCVRYSDNLGEFHMEHFDDSELTEELPE